MPRSTFLPGRLQVRLLERMSSVAVAVSVVQQWVSKGITTVTISYPLDLLRVRLAYETRGLDSRGPVGVIAVGRAIYNEPPVILQPFSSTRPLATALRIPLNLSNFYRGFGLSLLGMVPYAGGSFYTYALLIDLCYSPTLRR